MIIGRSLPSAHRFDQLEPVHVRHLRIDDHEIRALSQNRVAAVDAILRRAHLIARIAQVNAPCCP